jgi:hypothetical protein
LVGLKKTFTPASKTSVSKSSSVTKLMILFLAVHALGDISTWPTECQATAWPKERPGDGDQPGPNNRVFGVFGQRGPMVFWPGFSVAAFKKDKRL